MIKANSADIINISGKGHMIAIGSLMGRRASKDKAMSTETMKAIRQHEFGGPEVLRYEDAPVPE